MAREFGPGEISQWRQGLSKDRALVDASKDPELLYFIPAGMEPNSDSSTESIHFVNVWAGLQQFQAYTNSSEVSLANEEKAAILSEIFIESNDLISLTGVVENQIGTRGVAKSLLLTHSWVDWQISPRIGFEVTEGNWAFKHINLILEVRGTNLKAISKRELVFDEKEKDKKKLRELEPRLLIYSDLRDKGYHEIDFDLVVIEASDDGSDIILNGVLEGRDVIQGYNAHTAFKLMRSGRMEIIAPSDFLTLEEVIEDLEVDKEPLIIDKENLQALGIYNPADWDSMHGLLTEDDEARRELLKFLLPYCDMPTYGIRYVLSEEHAEEMINRIGAEQVVVDEGGYVRL